jgi:hypothetical protein
MSGPGEKPKPSRGNSKASSPDRNLERFISGSHLADQYHGNESYVDKRSEEDVEEHDESGDEADICGNDTASEAGIEKERSEHEEAGNEVRDAAAAEKDLEAGRLDTANMVGSKRSRTRDLTLVTWEGPDDPENPKNWPLGRKWVATLVGKRSPTLS